MHPSAALRGTALVQGLIQRIEHAAGMGSSADASSDDAPREGVNDECQVHKALPVHDPRMLCGPPKLLSEYSVASAVVHFSVVRDGRRICWRR